MTSPSPLRTVMADLPLPPLAMELLRDQVQLVAWTAHPSRPDESVQGIYTFGHSAVTGELLDCFPAVRVISNHGVGVDHIDVQAAANRGIPVGNTPGVLSGATADLGFTILLAAARRILESARCARDKQTRQFDSTSFYGREVHGATLGIIGMGRIGTQVARRASGFDMPILYHNRNRNLAGESVTGAQYVSLSDLLSRSDFVLLAVPLNSSTTGLIGAAELGQMRPTAILVNISRGPVVDTDALVGALRAGQIWGAALDVTEPEPLPRDHPLLQMDNALITSHIGSATEQTRRKMMELSIENLLLGLRGEPLAHAVPVPPIE